MFPISKMHFALGKKVHSKVVIQPSRKQQVFQPAAIPSSSSRRFCPGTFAHVTMLARENFEIQLHPRQTISSFLQHRKLLCFCTYIYIRYTWNSLKRIPFYKISFVRTQQISSQSVRTRQDPFSAMISARDDDWSWKTIKSSIHKFRCVTGIILGAVVSKRSRGIPGGGFREVYGISSRPTVRPPAIAFAFDFATLRSSCARHS